VGTYRAEWMEYLAGGLLAYSRSQTNMTDAGDGTVSWVLLVSSGSSRMKVCGPCVVYAITVILTEGCVVCTMYNVQCRDRLAAFMDHQGLLHRFVRVLK
jgi:hypothetical protein